MPSSVEGQVQASYTYSPEQFAGTIKAHYPFWDGYHRPYLIESVRRLPADQFEWKPRPDMFTAAQHVLHIAEAENWWIHHIVDGEPYRDYVVRAPEGEPGWVTDYDAPDHNALLFVLEEAHRHTQRWFGFPVKELSRRVTRTRRDGVSEEFSLHWVLEHVQEHELHHRAQLITYLRLLGIDPPAL
jgi:uncharacterized damage-inducible protein DinB